MVYDPVHLIASDTNFLLQRLTYHRTGIKSIVQWGTTRHVLSKETVGESETYSHDSYTSGAIHSVTLTSLHSGQTYYYRCGDPAFGVRNNYLIFKHS